MQRKPVFVIVLSFFSILLLSSCGVKGRLKLPPEPPAAKPASAVQLSPSA